MAGSSLKFLRVSLVTRILSATGLKSMPNAVPFSTGVNCPATAVAAPVDVSSV